MTTHAEVGVLGMGPGGEDVAGRLAEAGMRVVGVEKRLVGGECPYWGCVPSKMIIRAADLLAEARRIPGVAGSSAVVPDWTPVAQRIRDQATDNWDDTVAVDRFVGKGGHFVRGAGRIVGPGAVSVNGDLVHASRAVVVATGTAPAIPPIPGLSTVPYWTNHDVMEATELPESLIVLGGGAIGLEIAQSLSRFGVQMTVIEALARLLPHEEAEVGEELARVLEREGFDVRVGTRAVHVERDGERIAVHLTGGDRIVADRLLVATGRRAELASLGLETVGIDPGLRWISVDDR